MSRRRVCVTGGTGYIGSWLVKKLLDRGCTVHATTRNLGDEGKTGLLRSLPGAAERLRLFEADIYDAATFEPAVAGCEFVFLVATPMMQNGIGSSKDATEVMIEATRTILRQCEQAKTVRRVIHTGSVMAASPFKHDGTGFRDLVDESCWSPLIPSCDYRTEGLDGYVSSKTLSEKELLGYNAGDDRAFEVVTLVCGLVGGDTLLPYVPDSVQVVVSPLTGAEPWLGGLRFMQAFLGAVPLLHVDDACEAHAFCMDPPSLAGRFLCAAAHPNLRDIVGHYRRRHPELNPPIKEVVGEGVRVEAGTSKLQDLGFKYRFGVEEVLDGSVECSKRLGLL
ncbi:hypothetical protein ACP4OV_028214 [Aristida adscensionis]